MKRAFFIFAAIFVFLISCSEEDRKIVVNDDKDNTLDEESIDNDVQDDNEVPDGEITDENNDNNVTEDSDLKDDESSDELSDENPDEIADTEPDSEPDEINDADSADCVGLGGTTGAYPGAPECCEGLQQVTMYDVVYESKIGYCQPLVGGAVCINCGNNVCDQGEDLCNCPEDCKEDRDERCDDGSIDMCDMIPPDDCEGSDILAIKDNCWACVDPLSCESTDRPAHCDDGTVPACYMMPPECGEGDVLAYVNSCYECLNEDTCE